ncbi:MAG: KilA-N domain-containing protein [Armatimonadetes bacterium]|nr:KilA-N domain-containing protein [Armatimonadota bacterium]
MQYTLAIIEHEIESTPIHQRASDGYVNATAMCKAAGKLFADYARTTTTREFLDELSSVMGIPITGLIESKQGGTPDLQGTWVHPKVAIHLAQWCSPKVAVAVTEWVHDWMTGKIKGKLPYHIQRYIANREEIPPTHWSMLNELTFAIIAPLETEGYTLPENMVPDISTGLLFCKWLRANGIDTNALPTYTHRYADGRAIPAKLYPNSVLADFRAYLHGDWIPRRAYKYFADKDPKALPHLPKLLPPPPAA